MTEKDRHERLREKQAEARKLSARGKPESAPRHAPDSSDMYDRHMHWKMEHEQRMGEKRRAHLAGSRSAKDTTRPLSPTKRQEMVDTKLARTQKRYGYSNHTQTPVITSLLSSRPLRDSGWRRRCQTSPSGRRPPWPGDRRPPMDEAALVVREWWAGTDMLS